jgi:hypothetical protein
MTGERRNDDTERNPEINPRSLFVCELNVPCRFDLSSRINDLLLVFCLSFLNCGPCPHGHLPTMLDYCPFQSLITQNATSTPRPSVGQVAI